MLKKKLGLSISVVLSLVSTGLIAGPLPQPVQDSDYYDGGIPNIAKVELGKSLYFDKILSGNHNISCSTCHHVLTDTGDGLSLSVGEGARGLGVTRDTGHGVDAIHERVPRNAQPVFNLGASEFSVIYHDGRISIDHNQPSGFASPAGANLPEGLDNPLAVQAMFPVTSGTEMAGQAGENPVADAAAIGDLAGPEGVWEQLAERLRNVPEYVDLFMAAYPEIIGAEDITFVHAANAIAAFEADAWRADDSPFDRFLRGNKKAMNSSAKKGMRLFYGKAGCSLCHSGKFQTDHNFYAIAMPQIGGGKGDGVDGLEDFGRERVTGNSSDRYKFRTPTLRNVALTGPWGHAGAYNSLRDVVLHHLDPVNSLYDYDTSQAVMPYRDDLDATDFVVQNNMGVLADIANANELEPIRLSERKIKHLIEFLHALTDKHSIDLRSDMPKEVASGLPLAD